MRYSRGLINGSLVITAYSDPFQRSGEGSRYGMIEIRFMNYPLDPDHISMMNDTVLQLIERAVEPPDKKEGA